MDGPIAGDYSIVSIGLVVIEPSLKKTFYAEVKPISDKWIPEALAVSGFTREQTMEFEEALSVFTRLEAWVKENLITGNPVFVADNPGFDFGAVNWYFHHFLGRNPFGWSSRRIGDLWCGMEKEILCQMETSSQN